MNSLENSWTGYECAKAHYAIRLHFTQSNYNVLKYGFDFKLDLLTYRNHRDRFTYERLSRTYNFYSFKIACATAHYYSEYVTAKALTFRGDFEPVIGFSIDPYPQIKKELEPYRNQDLFARGKNMQLIYELMLEKKLSPETVAILIDFEGIRETGMPQLRQVALLLKYAAFFGYEIPKIAALRQMLAKS